MTDRTVYFRLPNGRIHATMSDMLASWYSDATRLTVKEGKAAFAKQAASDLRDILKPGDTVHTVLRRRSSSGMSRHISLMVACEGNENSKGKPFIRDITRMAAEAVQGWKVSDDTGGIVISGCGMDMGFDAVYTLGRTLWPNGTDAPHSVRNGEPDREGGYALQHVWL